MCAKWISKSSDPGPIISKLNECRKQKSNKVSYQGLGFLFLRSALVTKIRFHKDLPKHQRDAILSRAISEPTPNGKISTNELINEISKKEHEYLRKKMVTYYLLTSISINGSMPFRKISYDGSELILQFPLEQFDHRRNRGDAVPRHYGSYPEEYKPVLIKICSRTEYDAGIDGLKFLDLVRGFWNLYYNEKQIFRITSGRHEAVNRIRLGPIHTVHNLDGSRVSKVYWYEPSYVTPGKRADVAQNAERIRIRTRRDLRTLRASLLREATIEGLIRYNRALDHWNWQAAFVELWSTLEYLTDTDGQSYKDTAKRAASIYSNYEYALEIAKHFRDLRNRAIHSAEPLEDAEEVIYELKTYAEQFLRLYLGNPLKFRSKSELGEFLDLPRNDEILRRRIRLSQTAIKFRTAKS